MEVVMEKLIDTGFEYLKDQVRWQTGMKEELERLRDIQYPKIQAVVSYASTQLEIKDQNPALNKWLWQLRDSIDEADDVLDDFEYKKHEEQLARNKEKEEQLTGNMEETKKRKFSSIASWMFESAHKIRKVVERALKIDPNLKRLEEVVQKLDKVSTEVSTFLPLLESTKQEQQLELYKTRETGSSAKNDLIGRGKEKDFVMQWLRKPSNEQTLIPGTNRYRNISLLSIVGHGGMGKTTLLQHVYEDEITKEFDLKIWVCVSNNFDAKRVISAMLESHKKKKPDLESLDALQESLKSEVLSKKFLLVLDDIWGEGGEKDKSKWEDVLAPLAYGSLGSKILVTTRMDSVASMIAKVIKKKKETMRLEGLEKDECLQLLNSHAFADVANPDGHKKLKSIAREIVEKLFGSPLAAKVIGGVLNSNLDESHWNKVLNSDFTESDQNFILSILRLSYISLSKPLQSCFAFCCIFPQDHVFDKDDLVRMWIAVGFIQPSYNQGETVEDIGGNYFDVLVKKFFFDKLATNHYKMHDLLHELAQFVSAQECFRVESDEESFFKIPKTIRHLSVKTRNLEMLKKIEKFKNLRSLFLSYEYRDEDFVEVLTEIFNASRSIRLFYIYVPSLDMIPKNIENLVHLRYLKIAGIAGSVITCIPELPISLSNIYHLQFIILSDSCYSTEFGYYFDNFLSINMNNFSNVRYLELPMHYFGKLHGIGKLKSLQILNGFYVKNEDGYRIDELEHMNELRKLRIKTLINVEGDKEARNAKLCDKRNLADLSLEWGHSSSNDFRNIECDDLHVRVLDNLQPHSELKNLRINSYMGDRSATWMKQASSIRNLQFIKLDDCLKWQTLPPFGQLPFLKSLHLANMPTAKRLEHKFDNIDKHSPFPSLEVLHIRHLEALIDWFDKDAPDNCFFPCLTELDLSDCPNLLQELPHLPPQLKVLKINKIGWETLNCCNNSKSNPLKTLQVLHCPNIKHIYLADEIPKLAELRNVTILDCPNIENPLVDPEAVETGENGQLILSEVVINDPSALLILPSSGIASLQKLTIKDNYELVSFSEEAEKWFLEASSSLCELEFHQLKHLRSLPSSLKSLSSLQILSVRNLPYLRHLPCLHSLSSLQRIYISKTPELRELPDLPRSLKYLTITDCHTELEKCYEKFSDSSRQYFLTRVPSLPR